MPFAPSCFEARCAIDPDAPRPIYAPTCLPRDLMYSTVHARPVCAGPTRAETCRAWSIHCTHGVFGTCTSYRVFRQSEARENNAPQHFLRDVRYRWAQGRKRGVAGLCTFELAFNYLAQSQATPVISGVGCAFACVRRELTHHVCARCLVSHGQG